MSNTRERIVDMAREFQRKAASGGATPEEAASFAARAARLIEEHQIRDAELRAARSHYDVLGVEKTAGEDNIKRAYRALAMKYHPDRNPGDSEAAARYKEVQDAYHVLSDSDRRAKYNSGPEYGAGEVCENLLRTGKRVFNPGMTSVVNGLALGMCCKVVLLKKDVCDHGVWAEEAVYGVVGNPMDADYVCQMAVTVVPALQRMAAEEGREHGHEKAGLVRWTNQYLGGAGIEIRRRLEEERKLRARQQELDGLQRRLRDHGSSEVVANLPGPVVDALLKSLRDGTFTGIMAHGKEPDPTNRTTALAIVTGESLAVAKREATEIGFKKLYPKTRKTHSRSSYDHTAHEAGREAGKRVPLHKGIGGGDR